MKRLGIETPITLLNEHNETGQTTVLLKSLKQGKTLALISDAGTPAISDPGLILVNKCIEENLSVHSIPGPSAVTSAVSVSGFSDQYLFYGFLTKKKNELNNLNLKNISSKILSDFEY